MSYFCEKYLLAAKELAAKDWSHPSCIRIARHMAHDGASVEEIAAALGWDVSKSGAWSRLRKFNIRPWGKTCRAHRGQETTLSSKHTGVGMNSYRAPTLGAPT